MRVVVVNGLAVVVEIVAGVVVDVVVVNGLEAVVEVVVVVNGLGSGC